MSPATFVPKSRAIENTVRWLRAALGEDAFEVIDHRSEDPAAVGLASSWDPRVVAYVMACPGGYLVELELPPGPGGSCPFPVTTKYAGLGFDRLMTLLRDHFQIGY